MCFHSMEFFRSLTCHLLQTEMYNWLLAWVWGGVSLCSQESTYAIVCICKWRGGLVLVFVPVGMVLDNFYLYPIDLHPKEADPKGPCWIIHLSGTLVCSNIFSVTGPVANSLMFYFLVDKRSEQAPCGDITEFVVVWAHLTFQIFTSSSCLE